MELTKVRIKEFQSIWDTNEFDITDVTCLVGKNEAGKTALLKALYKLNPLIQSESVFDVTDDYPRKEVEDYILNVENGTMEHSRVVEATFKFEKNDLSDFISDFGKNVITGDLLILERGYDNKTSFTLNLDVDNAHKNLIKGSKLTPELNKKLSESGDFEKSVEILDTEEVTEEVTRLKELFQAITKEGLKKFAYKTYKTINS